MSSDNGIYILTTHRRTIEGGDRLEYRVRELQCVENVDWDASKVSEDGRQGDYTEDDEVRIVNAREMWDGCQVYEDEAEVLLEAKRLYEEVMEDVGILEYGICFIHIDMEF